MPRQKSSPHTVTGDAKEVWNLIANARAAGIDVSSVSVGTCRVELRAPATGAPAPSEQRDPRQAIYEAFGGDAYRRMVGGQPSGPAAVPGEEFQPALEVE